MIKIGTFRKNVMRVLEPKSAKAALRLSSRTTHRTQLAQLGSSLALNVGRMQQSLTDYLLGQEYKEEHSLVEVMGDIGADLVALCRLLKIKTPTSTRRMKMLGTRSLAILHLSGHSIEILGVTSGMLFHAPKTKESLKQFTNPQNGLKETKPAQVVDEEAEAQEQAAREDVLRSLVSYAVQEYWKLCYSLFKQSPAFVLEEKMERLKSEHPQIQFETEEPQKEPVAA